MTITFFIVFALTISFIVHSADDLRPFDTESDFYKDLIQKAPKIKIGDLFHEEGKLMETNLRFTVTYRDDVPPDQTAL